MTVIVCFFIALPRQSSPAQLTRLLLSASFFLFSRCYSLVFCLFSISFILLALTAPEGLHPAAAAADADAATTAAAVVLGGSYEHTIPLLYP